MRFWFCVVNYRGLCFRDSLIVKNYRLFWYQIILNRKLSILEDKLFFIPLSTQDLLLSTKGFFFQISIFVGVCIFRGENKRNGKRLIYYWVFVTTSSTSIIKRCFRSYLGIIKNRQYESNKKLNHWGALSKFLLLAWITQ